MTSGSKNQREPTKRWCIINSLPICEPTPSGKQTTPTQRTPFKTDGLASTWFGMVSGQAHLGEKLFGAFTSVSKPEDVPSQLVMDAESVIRTDVFLDVPARSSCGS